MFPLAKKEWWSYNFWKIEKYNGQIGGKIGKLEIINGKIGSQIIIFENTAAKFEKCNQKLEFLKNIMAKLKKMKKKWVAK